MDFYVDDFLADTDSLSDAATGFWIRLLCHLWRCPNRGQAAHSMVVWGQIGRVATDRARRHFDELEHNEICDISREGVGPNENLTVVSRRMVRDEIARNDNNLRQRKFYHTHKPNGNLTSFKHEYNGQPNHDLTPNLTLIQQKPNNDTTAAEAEASSTDRLSTEESPVGLPDGKPGQDSDRFTGTDYSQSKPLLIESYEDIAAIQDPIVAAISLTQETSKRSWGFWVKVLNQARASHHNGQAERLFRECLAETFGEMRQGEIKNPGAVFNNKLKRTFNLT